MHGGNTDALAQEAGIDPNKILDFSANINPLGIPDSVKAALHRSTDDILRYPDPECSKLTEKAASFYGVPVENIVIGNGSSQLLFALFHAIAPRRMVIPFPSYLDYVKAANECGNKVIPYYLDEEEGFRLDFQDLQTVTEKGDGVIIGRPNNPTGIVPTTKELLEAIEKEKDRLWIIDEAFIDFTKEESFVGKGHDNLIVLRSLTKIFAIPGLRLGVMIAPLSYAEQTKRRLPPWSVNTLAQKCGLALFEEGAFIKRSAETVRNYRKEMEEGLRKIPVLKLYPGEANYIFMSLKRGSCGGSVLRNRLLEEGIAIRLCDDYEGLGRKYLRVAVKTPQENAHLIETMKDALEGKTIRKQKQKKPALMIQGTNSNAGKSILVAALCRILLDDGIAVAPFKAQNMSNNSFVTIDGLEMGRAQATQATAARLKADIRMNPVLLKPNSETGSQVILRGKAVGNCDFRGYRAMQEEAFIVVKDSYESIAQEVDVMILEGAGSPAEINLKGCDIVNMAMAQYAEANVYLVGDIDRGGVFASFIGTYILLDPKEKKLLKGFLINRFRGDVSLLSEAEKILQNYTGCGVTGIIDYLPHLNIPEEDSVSFKDSFPTSREQNGEVDIAVIDLPHISNFTDLDPLLYEDDVTVRKCDSPEKLGKPDLVIIPGSKNTLSDLHWIKECKLDGAIITYHESGGRILGICGGYQILGSTVRDPQKVESSYHSVDGLALIPMETVMGEEKILARSTGKEVNTGDTVSGYEIHHGRSSNDQSLPWIVKEDGEILGSTSAERRVFGSYLHGLFDETPFRRSFLGELREVRGLPPLSGNKGYSLNESIDRLAEHVRKRINLDQIYRELRL